MDGFDDGLFDASTFNYKGYQATGDRPSPSTSHGRFGTKGVRIGDTVNDYMQRTGLETSDTLIVGAAINIVNVGGTTGEFLYAFYDSVGQINGFLDINLDGSVTYINGDGQNQGSSAAGAVPIGSWIYFEVKVKFNATTGTVDVRVNGTSILSLTGKDTMDNSGLAECGILNITTPGSGGLHDVYMDDLVIMDDLGSAPYNDFLGDVHIETLFPNGNGNSSQMTGSDGNSTDNYLLVDEDPIVLTDYVESSTVNDHDSYAMDNLSATPTTIYGIQIYLVAQKDDTGARSMRPMLRTGSTDYYGTGVALGTGWAGIGEIWEQNPNTTAAWTGANIDAIEVGQEVSA